MRRKIDDKKTVVIKKVQISGEDHYIVRDEDYIYIPYILGLGSTWENDGFYIAVPLKEIERIDNMTNIEGGCTSGIN